jgi:hypothetical protein
MTTIRYAYAGGYHWIRGSKGPFKHYNLNDALKNVVLDLTDEFDKERFREELIKSLTLHLCLNPAYAPPHKTIAVEFDENWIAAYSVCDLDESKQGFRIEWNATR